MVENGVTLYGEADKFERVAGTLLKYIHPPNTASVDDCTAAYRCAIGSMAEILIEGVRVNHPDEPASSVQRQRKNRTISVIRRLRAKFSKAAPEKLEQHVWKG
jgi:hypothetical protein